MLTNAIGNSPLLEWTTLPHFWIAVFCPFVLASWWGFESRQPLHSNATLILVALLLTIASALPPFNVFANWFGARSSDVHAIPFFPLLYLLLRKPESLMPKFAYGMSFLTLFITDIVASVYGICAGTMPHEQFPAGIGAGGVKDGLVVLPILGATAIWLGSKRVTD